MRKKRRGPESIDIAEAITMFGVGWLTLRGAKPEEIAEIAASVSEAVKHAQARIDDLNERIVETVLGGRIHGGPGDGCDCGLDDCPINRAAQNHKQDMPS